MIEDRLKQREVQKRLKQKRKRNKYLQMLLDRKAERARVKQAHYDNVTSDEHFTFNVYERTLIQEGFGQ